MNPNPMQDTVKIIFEGKEYVAPYRAEKGCVTVSSNWGEPKSGTYSVLGAERIAEHLLREILEDAKRNGRLKSEISP